MNKTMGNFKKPSREYKQPKQSKESTIEFEEMRMLVKMGFQKKKANFQMLKEWDKKRADNLALHGRIIDLLQNEVDLRIKSSL